MKKSNMNKTRIIKKSFHSRLITSLLRALKIIGDETKSESDLQVSKKGLSSALLTYDEPQRMNVYLHKMEQHKAEAVWLVNERNRRGI